MGKMKFNFFFSFFLICSTSSTNSNKEYGECNYKPIIDYEILKECQEGMRRLLANPKIKSATVGIILHLEAETKCAHSRLDLDHQARLLTRDLSEPLGNDLYLRIIGDTRKMLEASIGKDQHQGNEVTKAKREVDLAASNVATLFIGPSVGTVLAESAGAEMNEAKRSAINNALKALQKELTNARLGLGIDDSHRSLMADQLKDDLYRDFMKNVKFLLNKDGRQAFLSLFYGSNLGGKLSTNGHENMQIPNMVRTGRLSIVPTADEDLLLVQLKLCVRDTSKDTQPRILFEVNSEDSKYFRHLGYDCGSGIFYHVYYGGCTSWNGGVNFCPDDFFIATNACNVTSEDGCTYNTEKHVAPKQIVLPPSIDHDFGHTERKNQNDGITTAAAGEKLQAAAEDGGDDEYTLEICVVAAMLLAIAVFLLAWNRNSVERIERRMAQWGLQRTTVVAPPASPPQYTAAAAEGQPLEMNDYSSHLAPSSYGPVWKMTTPSQQHVIRGNGLGTTYIYENPAFQHENQNAPPTGPPTYEL